MKLPKPPDIMRGLLAALLVGAFMLALSWLFQHAIPASNEQLVTFMLGQLSGFAGAAVAYYLGTSKSSSDKNEMLRDRDNLAPPPPSPPVNDQCDCGEHEMPHPEFGKD